MVAIQSHRRIGRGTFANVLPWGSYGRGNVSFGWQRWPYDGFLWPYDGFVMNLSRIDSVKSLSGMGGTLWMSMIHVIARQAEDLVGTCCASHNRSCRATQVAHNICPLLFLTLFMLLMSSIGRRCCWANLFVIGLVCVPPLAQG